jgi:hypothetical protein
MKTIKSLFNRKIILTIFCLLLFGYCQCSNAIVQLKFVACTKDSDNYTSSTFKYPDDKEKLISFLQSHIVKTAEIGYLNPPLPGQEQQGQELPEQELNEVLDILTGVDSQVHHIIFENRMAVQLGILAFKLNIQTGVIEHLAEILAKDNRLDELELASCTLDAKKVKPIAEALSKNRRLKKLNLSGNYIGNEGAEAIAEALKEGAVLTELNLSGNYIGDEGAEAIAEALEEGTVLAELDLAFNQIHDKGAGRLAEAILTHPTLFKLNIMANEIGAGGLKSFIPVVSENTHLTHFDFNDEPRQQYMKKAVTMLLKALVANNLVLQSTGSLLLVGGPCWVRYHIQDPESQIMERLFERNRLLAQYRKELMGNVGLALACGLHPRLGTDSCINNVSQLIVKEIYQDYIKDDDEGFYCIAQNILKATPEELKNMGFNEKTLEHIRLIREAHKKLMHKLWEEGWITVYRKILTRLGMNKNERKDEMNREAQEVTEERGGSQSAQEENKMDVDDETATTAVPQDFAMIDAGEQHGESAVDQEVTIRAGQQAVPQTIQQLQERVASFTTRLNNLRELRDQQISRESENNSSAAESPALIALRQVIREEEQLLENLQHELELAEHQLPSHDLGGQEQAVHKRLPPQPLSTEERESKRPRLGNALWPQQPAQAQQGQHPAPLHRPFLPLYHAQHPNAWQGQQPVKAQQGQQPAPLHLPRPLPYLPYVLQYQNAHQGGRPVSLQTPPLFLNAQQGRQRVQFPLPLPPPQRRPQELQAQQGQQVSSTQPQPMQILQQPQPQTAEPALSAISNTGGSATSSNGSNQQGSSFKPAGDKLTISPVPNKSGDNVDRSGDPALSSNLPNSKQDPSNLYPGYDLELFLKLQEQARLLLLGEISGSQDVRQTVDYIKQQASNLSSEEYRKELMNILRIVEEGLSDPLPSPRENNYGFDNHQFKPDKYERLVDKGKIDTRLKIHFKKPTRGKIYLEEEPKLQFDNSFWFGII